MKIFNSSTFQGLKIIIFKENKDLRGSFTRFFCKDIFKKNKIFNNPNQINLSYNKKKGIFRGFHFQKYPYAEEKVISCIEGEIFLCLLDLRKKKRSYLKIYKKKFDSKKFEAIYVPKGFATAFLTLKHNTKVIYYMSRSYVPGYSSGVNYRDPNIKIKWPVKINIISPKDKNLPFVK